jgi:hypothetical protein
MPSRVDDPVLLALPAPTSFPKDRAQAEDGPEFAGQVPPLPDLPLSPLEQEILSICLNSPEDPRDVGILPALLCAERLDRRDPRR